MDSPGGVEGSSGGDLWSKVLTASARRSVSTARYRRRAVMSGRLSSVNLPVAQEQSPHFHVARPEGNRSGHDPLFAKSGELPPEALVRVDAIRETCLANFDCALDRISSPKLICAATSSSAATKPKRGSSSATRKASLSEVSSPSTDAALDSCRAAGVRRAIRRTTWRRNDSGVAISTSSPAPIASATATTKSGFPPVSR